MGRLTEDYVTLETAKLLKIKGFSEYKIDSIVYKKFFRGNTYEIDGKLVKVDEDIVLPTIQMAIKWLRKKHMIFIQPNIVFTAQPICYYAAIYCYGDNLKTQQDVTTERYKTPEEACEAAVRYCVEKII